MKSLIAAFFLFGAFPAFSQKQKDLQQQYDQLQIRYNALIDSLASTRTQLELFVSEMESNRQSSANDIAAYKAENEKLKQLMRNYIVQIDNLNTVNLKLEEALKECKGSK